MTARIAGGTSIEQALRTGHVTAARLPIRTVQEAALGDASALEGQVFTRTVYPGEQITTHVLAAP